MNSVLQTTEKALGLSEKYRFISTGNIVEQLQGRGFELNKVSSTGSHGHHILRFSKNDEAFKIGSDKIELVVRSAHDGTRALTFNLGVFRVVCMNGLTLGTNLVPPMRILHRGQGNIEKEVFEIVNGLPLDTVRDNVRLLKETTLTHEQGLKFVVDATKQRLGLKRPKGVEEQLTELSEAEQANKIYLASRKIMRVRREEDTGMSTWNVFNIVQENIIRGTRGLRPLTSQQRIHDTNQSLFDLAVQAANSSNSTKEAA